MYTHFDCITISKKVPCLQVDQEEMEKIEEEGAAPANGKKVSSPPVTVQTLVPAPEISCHRLAIVYLCWRMGFVQQLNDIHE